MKICLLGSQGTGKSTLAGLFKGEYEVIDGITRKCIADGCKSNKEGDAESQDTIMRAYLNAFQGKDNFISTRSAIDVLAYTAYLHTNKPSTEINDCFVKQSFALSTWLEDNDDIVFCYLPVEFNPEGDGVRCTDPRYQEDIDICMRQVLRTMSIPAYVITGTIGERKRKLQKLIDDIKFYGVDQNRINKRSFVLYEVE